MMLTIEEREWLLKMQPKLRSTPDGISGTVDFTATYNEQNGKFQVLYDDGTDEIGGLRLSGSFEVRLESRTDKSVSKLPALYVSGVEPIADRHFAQMDYSACLCSPLEEDDFLPSRLDLICFFQELVIPFLYGQQFFSMENRWPWPEYAHGATGLLEAYFKNKDSDKAQQCLQVLVNDPKVWPRIKSLLSQKGQIKGHTGCFCKKADHIRRCHPSAWQGIRQLQADIRLKQVPLL